MYICVMYTQVSFSGFSPFVADRLCDSRVVCRAAVVLGRYLFTIRDVQFPTNYRERDGPGTVVNESPRHCCM